MRRREVTTRKIMRRREVTTRKITKEILGRQIPDEHDNQLVKNHAMSFNT